jgi:nucleoid-associated protein YgaU
MIEHVFGSHLLPLGAVLLIFLAVLGTARGTSGAAPEVRYVVRRADTLWRIAVERYGGDPREAVWRIEERNGLESPLIRPGQLLVLP